MGQLAKRPELLVIADVLAPNWDPTNTKGYDLGVTNSSDSAYLPHGTALDQVGEQYPSVVVTFSNESTPTESGYSYLGGSQPTQDFDGSVVATLRAQEDRDYEADGTTAVEAERINYLLEQEIKRVCRANAGGAGTELYNVAAFPAGAVTDDRDEVPPVRIRTVTIVYDYLA